jgi:hypothetical protein
MSLIRSHFFCTLVLLTTSNLTHFLNANELEAPEMSPKTIAHCINESLQNNEPDSNLPDVLKVEDDFVLWKDEFEFVPIAISSNGVKYYQIDYTKGAPRIFHCQHLPSTRSAVDPTRATIIKWTDPFGKTRHYDLYNQKFISAPNKESGLLVVPMREKYPEDCKQKYVMIPDSTRRVLMKKLFFDASKDAQIYSGKAPGQNDVTYLTPMARRIINADYKHINEQLNDDILKLVENRIRTFERFDSHREDFVGKWKEFVAACLPFIKLCMSCNKGSPTQFELNVDGSKKLDKEGKPIIIQNARAINMTQFNRPCYNCTNSYKSLSEQFKERKRNPDAHKTTAPIPSSTTSD